MNRKLQARDLLHDRLVRALRPEVLGAEPGARFAGEYELAARHGVCVVTAREALRTLVQEGLLVRYRGSGTYVADRAKGQPVGVLLELDISHPRTSRFHLRVAQRLCTWFREQGLRVRLYTGTVDPGEHAERITAAEFEEDFAAGRLCGAAVVYGPWGTPWHAFFGSAPTPNVGLWNGYNPFEVRLDYAGMLTAAVEALVARGRRHLALIGWGMDNSPAGQDRSTAQQFKRLLRERGLEAKDAWIRTDFQPAQPGAGWEEFREIWATAHERPDALIILDDMLFDDAKTAIRDLGIAVPEDLAVVTHANANVPLSAPFPFSRAVFDPDACAEAMGALLLGALRRQPSKEKARTLGFAWCAETAPIPGGAPRRGGQAVCEAGVRAPASINLDPARQLHRPH